MVKIFKKMNKLLDAKQKRIMVVIVFLMLIGGVLESLSISVVIPVYNTAEYIEECLDSLFAQEYRDIEYILVDDGSKDNSYAVCEEIAKNTPKRCV